MWQILSPLFPAWAYILISMLPERGVFAKGGRKSLPAVQQAAVAAMRKDYLRKALNAAREIYKVCLSSRRMYCMTDNLAIHIAYLDCRFQTDVGLVSSMSACCRWTGHLASTPVWHLTSYKSSPAQHSATTSTRPASGRSKSTSIPSGG